jgi:hypothetical protein
LGSILGGSQVKAKDVYKGDRFFDKDNQWHLKNIKEEIDYREKNEDILILFYRIDSNYLLKDRRFGVVKLEKKDSGYLNPDSVLTFAAVTPAGGPSYEVSTNSLVV